MTFDEQLRRAFETVTGRLRDDIARHTQTVLEELATAAETDRAQAVATARDAAKREADARTSAAVAAAEADARSAAERAADTRIGVAVAAAEAKARESGKEEGRRAGVLEGRRQAEQESDEKVDAAIAAARAEWRSAERAASERLVHAVRSIERARSLTDILDALVRSAAHEASRVAVLLLARGARFRGWRFIGFDPSLDEANPIEFGADEAGVIHEAARTGGAVSGTRAGAPAFAELPADCACFAIPITLGGQVVAVLWGSRFARPASRDSSSVWSHTLEVLARHAAGCLETQTALKAAGIWRDRPASPDSSPAADAALDHPAGDDDLAARRYARLLVSEIKLYHEADVVAGRRDRDLTKRLGGEIARARVLYDQRVAPHVRQSVDYFHAELIQTLANGDETLLEDGKPSSGTSK